MVEECGVQNAGGDSANRNVSVVSGNANTSASANASTSTNAHIYAANSIEIAVMGENIRGSRIRFCLECCR